MDEKLKSRLRKMHYGIVGDNAAVLVCLWTKRAICGEGGCWKEKFYGVESASCCQMTPNVMNCENQCLHCWRPIEFNLGKRVKGEILKPGELLDGIIKERKRLMNGFLGNKRVDKKKFLDAMEPKLYTLSLSGEPTLYPYLGELFSLIRKKGAVSFLVTNGQNPDALKKLRKQGLPTQITLSTNASNKKLFLKWHNSCGKNSWETFLDTLDILKSLKGEVRRVVRLTLVKKGRGESKKYNDLSNMEEEHVDEYVDLINRAEPDFVHVKGFKSIGFSRERFPYDKQPWFSEVKNFAGKLKNKLKNYEIKGEEKRSCVVLLVKKGARLKIAKV